MGNVGNTPTNVPIQTADLEDNIVTLAKMAGGTDGNLIGIDANGDPAYISTGTDGQVLTSGGAGVAASMEAAAAGGAWTFISRTAESAVASTTVTGVDSATYDTYVIKLTGIDMVSDQDLWIRCGNGSVDATSNYYWHSFSYQPNTTTINQNNGGLSNQMIASATSVQSNGDPFSDLFFYLSGSSVATVYTGMHWHGHVMDGTGGYPTINQGAGQWGTKGVMDRVQFLPASGNFDVVVSVYGINIS